MSVVHRTLLSAALAVSLMSGCAPTMIGGTTIGAPSNIDERAASEQLDDRLIENRIDQQLSARFGNEGRARWRVASFNRRVVLVGQATDEATRTEMERIARSVAQVRSVANEVTVGPPVPIETRTTDTAIAANLRRRLMNDAGAGFTSLKVLVDNRVAHLIGRVSAQQAQIATHIARSTDGVQRVVTHWDTER